VSKVLVVDDDEALLRALRIGLTARGYEVSLARTGAEGVKQVSLVQPDVIVLDLGLPDMDGADVCRGVRRFSAVPILVLSAAANEERKVAALDLGADDYITKPFGMAELEARLRVALRRGGRAPDSSTELSVGDLDVDLVHHMASVAGHPLELTAKEFDLLAFLARHAGKVCTHHMILAGVWGPGYGSESQYLRVYAHRLRRKLGAHGAMLRTQPGVGYQLVADPA